MQTINSIAGVIIIIISIPPYKKDDRESVMIILKITLNIIIKISLIFVVKRKSNIKHSIALKVVRIMNSFITFFCMYISLGIRPETKFS